MARIWSVRAGPKRGTLTWGPRNGKSYNTDSHFRVAIPEVQNMKRTINFLIGTAAAIFVTCCLSYTSGAGSLAASALDGDGVMKRKRMV